MHSCPLSSLCSLYSVTECRTVVPHLLNAIDDCLRRGSRSAVRVRTASARCGSGCSSSGRATFSEMTDLPQALRDELAGDFALWTHTSRQAHAGRRRHREAAAHARRRRADRVRAAPRRSAPHDLHQHAGRLRHGLRVLRQRPRRRRRGISPPAKSSSRCCGCSGCSRPTSGSATSS